MSLLVGRNGGPVASAASKWGWAETTTDWREAIARDDIDVIDIVTPGDSHAEIAIAALEAGKHVLCEKPLANTVDEAEAMADAAERAAARGVFAMVGFTYRRVPAATFARELVAEGAIGDVRQVRAEYLQDWLVDETAPLAWRLQKEHAGSGALGDIGAHAIDLSQFITGQRLTGVSGTIDTVVTERPLLGRGQRALGHRRRRIRRRHRRRRRPVHRPFRGRGARRLRRLPHEHGPQERTAHRGLGLSRSHRLRPRGHERAAFYDEHGACRPQGFTKSSSPSRCTPTSHLVARRAHARLRARLRPPGRRTSWRRSPTGIQPTPSFADGLQVQRVLGAVEQSSASHGIWTATAA